jgi:hypothetical protein
VENNLKQLELNMPLAPESSHQRKKRFLALFAAVGAVLGIAGTAFGISNSATLTDINSKLAQQKQQTDLLVDILQIHTNHLHEIDTQSNLLRYFFETF